MKKRMFITLILFFLFPVIGRGEIFARVYANDTSIQIDEIIVDGGNVAYLASFSVDDTLNPPFVGVWFEYGRDKGNLSQKTMESIHTRKRGKVRHRVYEILDPGVYFVRPVLNIQNNGKVYGALQTFEIEEGGNGEEYSPYYEYSPYGERREDHSQIAFQDDGTLKENDRIFTFAHFWNGVKEFFGFSTREKEEKEEKEENRKSDESHEDYHQLEVQYQGEQKENYYNPKSAAFDKERGEVLSYNTQYQKYYRPANKAQKSAFRGDAKSVGKLNYFPLILLLLVLMLVILFMHFSRRSAIRRGRNILPSSKRTYSPPQKRGVVIRRNPKTRIVGEKSPKYTIPHKDIQEARKEVDEGMHKG